MSKINSFMFKLYLTGIETVPPNQEPPVLRVQIASCWNWNMALMAAMNGGASSNCTLLELKLLNASSLIPSPFRSNCTLLELKRTWRNVKNQFFHVQIAPYWNWNKSSSLSNRFPLDVQIVPYWNWNNPRIVFFRLELSSNCTLLELKLQLGENLQESKSVQIAPYWNWNWAYWTANHRHLCSNCTILELKLSGSTDNSTSNTVQIVPYWNWNWSANPIV